jgi:hypothetical protein
LAVRFPHAQVIDLDLLVVVVVGKRKHPELLDVRVGL